LFLARIWPHQRCQISQKLLLPACEAYLQAAPDTREEFNKVHDCLRHRERSLHTVLDADILARLRSQADSNQFQSVKMGGFEVSGVSQIDSLPLATYHPPLFLTCNL